MKNKLLEILENPNDKLIAIDLDGTICEGEFWGEGNPTPKPGMQDFMWKLYTKGAHIIIYTARQSRYFADTQGWLMKYGIPFHGICMNVKPGADLYIDDRALNMEDINLVE